MEGDRGVDGGDRRFVRRLAGCRGERGGHVGQTLDVLGGGSTAPTDDLHAEFFDEAPLVDLEFFCRQVVVHLSVDHRWQPGVGQHRNGHAGVVGQVADVLAHLGRPGGTVEPDDVDAEGVDGRQGSSDLGADQHATGQLHGHLGLNRHLASNLGHGSAGRDHRRLEGQEIEMGLEDEQVDPAFEQGLGRHLVVVAQFHEADLVQTRRLGARAQRSGHEPLPVRVE